MGENSHLLTLMEWRNSWIFSSNDFLSTAIFFAHAPDVLIKVNWLKLLSTITFFCLECQLHIQGGLIMGNLQLMRMLSLQSRRIHMNIMGFGNLTITMGFMFLRNPMLVTKQSQIWRCYQNCMQPQRRMDSCLILLEC